MKLKFVVILAIGLLAGCNNQESASLTPVTLKDGTQLNLSGALIASTSKPGKLGRTQVNRLRYPSTLSAQKEIDEQLSGLGYSRKQLDDPRGLRAHYSKPSSAVIRTLLVESEKAGAKTTTATLYWTE